MCFDGEGEYAGYGCAFAQDELIATSIRGD